jgi:hypothetical protein
MFTHSTRDEIVEVVHKLFIYTDNQDWEKLQSEVFTHEVFFDMSSMNGNKEEKTAEEICRLWQKGFEGLDAVNHLCGNIIVNIQDTTASVLAYATATHFKSDALNGKTRDFIGTYNIGLLKLHGGDWRIYEFRYNLKFATGNTSFT